MKIIIDNGHGNNTKGKRSPIWQNGKQLFEYEFNRDVAKQVDIILRSEGYDSEILVPEEYDVPIRERVNRANEINKSEKSILISIHGNAAPQMNSQPNGIEVFHYSEKGKILANVIQEELVSEMGWKDRGVRKAYQRIKNKKGKQITIYKIAILKFTEMIAVLSENGFYTNFDECMKMLNPDIRSGIALGHVHAIKKYLFTNYQ